MSLPSRERELKLIQFIIQAVDDAVAPFTGARVETIMNRLLLPIKLGRSLHGSAS